MTVLSRIVLISSLGVLSSGPAVAQTPTPTPEELSNKELVEEFWRVVLQAGHLDRAGDYYAVDMIQHNPNVPTGLAGFMEFFTRVRAGKEPAPVKPTIDNHVLTAVDGELVMLLRRADVPEPTDSSQTYEAFSFDLFRVRGGKIVEHWDAARKPVGAQR